MERSQNTNNETNWENMTAFSSWSHPFCLLSAPPPAPPHSVAPACTSLVSFYSQNSCSCDSSFPEQRNVSPPGPADGTGWGLGWGPGPFLQGERDGCPPPSKSPNPIAENHCQLSWQAYPCLHQSWERLLVDKEPDGATDPVERTLLM